MTSMTSPVARLYSPCQHVSHSRSKIYKSLGPLARVSSTRCHASSSSDDSKKPPVNEDVLAKLRQFEAENAKLRAKLAEQGSSGPVPRAPLPQARAPSGGKPDRKGMQRETMFTDGQSKQSDMWLSEKDVDFFTGGGSLESGQSGAMSEDAQATVNKRVLIGGALTVALGAFALVPTESLDGGASKPLSFYLVPVIRSVALLDDLATDIEESGDMDKVTLVITRVIDRPNEARKNMYAAIESLDNGPSKQKARETVGNFVDYVQQADSNKYYDNFSARDGKIKKEMAEFSVKSIRAAAKSGREFLQFFPPSEVRAAKLQTEVN